jgi:uncharacterized protein (TIGR00106 family)
LFSIEKRRVAAFTLAGTGAILYVGAKETKNIFQGGSPMSILAEFSVVPIGKGVSLSPVVAEVLRIVADSGVAYKANSMGTVLEGSWDEVMGVVKRCHDSVMKDSERVLTSIRIDDRKGGGQRMEKKLEAVEQRLGMKLKK